ncbi:unnamed protein product [Closterium sp. NIES-54]
MAAYPLVRRTEPHCTAELRCPTACTAPAGTAAMASPNVLTFDAEGRAVDFDWTTRDTVACLAVRSHLPSAERTHFGQYKTAKALYDAFVARYSSPPTTALSRLMLPYRFPDLSAFATVADLITHLRTSDTRYRAALPTDFCAKNPPPMYITLYYLVTCLPDSLASVLLAATVAPLSLRGVPVFPFSPQLLLLLQSTSLALRRSGLRLLLVGGAATARARGERVVEGTVGAAVEAVEEAEGVAVEVGVVAGVEASVVAVGVVEEAAAAVEAAEVVVEVAAAVVLVELREWYAGRGRSGGAGPCTYVLCTDRRRGETCRLPHTAQRCFGCLTGAWRAQYPDAVELPRWGDLLKQNVAIFDLDFDAILAVMYAVTDIAEGDSYLSVPPDPGIEAAALDASASAAPGVGECAIFGTAPIEALHTFTLDSGASRSFFRDSTTLTPLSRPVVVSLADPSGSPVLAHSSTVLPCPAAPSGLLLGLHLPSFSTSLVSGADLQDAWRYFLLIVDDYSRYTTVFPLRSKGEVTEVLIVWIRGARRQLSESFGSDLPILRLHSDRGEVSSDLLRAFCRAKGIRQTFTLSASPQQNEIAECRIGMYVAHQINVQPRLSLPETTPTLRWTGKVGDVSVFRVWGSRAFVRDTSADKLSSRAIPCVFLGFPPDAPGWQFYHPTLHHVLSSQDVTFDESVSYNHLFPYRTASLTPPPLFLAPGTPPVDPLSPQGPAPSGVSQVDTAKPVEVAIDSGAARGAEPAGAGIGGVEPGGAEPECMEPGGAESGGIAFGGAELAHAESRGSPGLPSPREPLCAAGAARGATGAGPAGGAAGAGAAGAAGGAAGAARGSPGTGAAGGTSGPAGGAAGAGAAGAAGGAVGAAGGAPGTGAAGGTCGAAEGATGAGAAGAAGTGGAAGVVVGDTGAEGASVVSTVSGGAARPRPYYVPLLKQVLGLPPSPGPTPPLLSPLPVQSQSQLQLASPLPGPSPYSGPTRGLTERLSFCVACPHCSTSRRASRPRPPPVPGTHSMTLRPSTAPQRVPMPSPPASSLPDGPDPESDSLRAASPTVTRLLATAVTDPLFESTTASAFVAELVDFSAACRLDYATSLVAESASASVCPPSVGGECALGTDVLQDR